MLGCWADWSQICRAGRPTIASINLRDARGRHDPGDALGFNAQIEFAGPLRLVISDDLADDIVAVVREGLSNVAKHARARHARVAVSLFDEVVTVTVTVTVTDDGVGIDGPSRDSGLANLRYRTECRGGCFTASVPEGGGTRLEWTAQVAVIADQPGQTSNTRWFGDTLRAPARSTARLARAPPGRGAPWRPIFSCTSPRSPASSSASAH
jgi:hypothetical protein